MIPENLPWRNSRCLPAPYRLSAALCPIASPFAPLLFAGRLEEGLRTIAELQYDAVEISLREAGEVDEGWLVEQLDMAGLAVTTLGTGRMYYEDRLSVTAADPQSRALCVQRLKAMLQLAARLGSALTVGGVRGVLPLDDQASRVRKTAANLLREVAEEAGALGVQLFLEPINRYETNFLNTVEETLAFVDEVDSPQIRLLLDTFHMNIEEVSLFAAMRLAGARLAFVHLPDSNRRAPGCGHLDLTAVMEVLGEIGYRGDIGMEILPWPDARKAAQLGRDHVHRLITQVMDPGKN